MPNITDIVRVAVGAAIDESARLHGQPNAFALPPIEWASSDEIVELIAIWYAKNENKGSPNA